MTKGQVYYIQFLSTLPAWGATTMTISICTVLKFLSTLPAWGATWLRCWQLAARDISIHAPRVGSDRYLVNTYHRIFISIHAPRVGSDPPVREIIQWEGIFLSTLPAWGATVPGRIKRSAAGISIHAPRVGSDGGITMDAMENPSFLSTLPAWGATTIFPSLPRQYGYFYPRSPRGERPRGRTGGNDEKQNFYPRSPRGERLQALFAFLCAVQFLSTLPAWGATGEFWT